jgi:hypothetical protein
MDETISIGKSINHKLDGSTSRLWSMYETDNLQDQYFNFNWTVTEYSSSSIKFRFYFEKPEQVSASGFGYDMLRVIFIEPELFIAKNYETLSEETVDNTKREFEIP